MERPDDLFIPPPDGVRAVGEAQEWRVPGFLLVIHGEIVLRARPELLNEGRDPIDAVLLS